MSVGGVGRGGGKGRLGGAKGAGGGAAASKAGGAKFGVVDQSSGLVGASGLVGSGNAQAASAADPVSVRARELAGLLKAGKLKKEEATKKLVDEVLKEKLRMKSAALSGKIAEALQDDPRLNQALERLWAKAE